MGSRVRIAGMPVLAPIAFVMASLILYAGRWPSTGDAVTFLIHQGHVDIALIEGVKGFQATAERKDGFFNALIDHQIPINGEYIVEGNYTMDSGY